MAGIALILDLWRKNQGFTSGLSSARACHSSGFFSASSAAASFAVGSSFASRAIFGYASLSTSGNTHLCALIVYAYKGWIVFTFGYKLIIIGLVYVNWNKPYCIQTVSDIQIIVRIKSFSYVMGIYVFLRLIAHYCCEI